MTAITESSWNCNKTDVGMILMALQGPLLPLHAGCVSLGYTLQELVCIIHAVSQHQQLRALCAFGHCSD
jgi:hypothetical protein